MYACVMSYEKSRIPKFIIIKILTSYDCIEKMLMIIEQYVLDTLNKTRIFVNIMVHDLPPNQENNQTILSMSTLCNAIENKDWKKGYIVLEGNNFNFGREMEGKDQAPRTYGKQKYNGIKVSDIGLATKWIASRSWREWMR